MDVLRHPIHARQDVQVYKCVSHPALSNYHFFSHVQVNAHLRIRDKGRPSWIRLLFVCVLPIMNRNSVEQKFISAIN